jgi:glycosyltransferase involved in cell wall biosynthesis
MKIIAIIPTLNESANISNITNIIDRGLESLGKNVDAIIINSDNGSVDGTTQEFIKTKTNFPKRIIINKQNSGKGMNIYSALKSYKNDSDYFLMFDADVISAKPVWVRKLLRPLLNGRAQLSVPIYQRNRYEGNATNHFSSPLIYACFGKYITQPIAGDFAFTADLGKKIFKSFSRRSDFGYGVDTLITWTAILNGYKITQVKLGRKIHAPSFPKIVTIFSDISNTTLGLLNNNSLFIRESLKNKKHISKVDVDSIDNKYVSIPSKLMATKVEKIAGGLLNNGAEHLDKKDWIKILHAYVLEIISGKKGKRALSGMAKELTGYYLLRVLGYFDEIEGQNIKFVKDVLKYEAKSLRRSLVL